MRGFLGGGEFRRLGIELACLAGSQEWHVETERSRTPPNWRRRSRNSPPACSIRRLKRLVQVDDDLAELDPGALHAIRLRAKRLRYAAEIFAPLYPAKAANRFIRRLSRSAGPAWAALNDGAVAAGLLARAERRRQPRFAIGLVLGFIGARQRPRATADRRGLAEIPPPDAVLGVTVATHRWHLSDNASKRKPTMPDNTAAFDLLAGVRIVDFTQFEAGPSCTEALAWLGAEVVKIENPKMGDPGPPAAPRPARQRPVLLPRVQRQQEVDHAEPEVAARPCSWSRTCCARPMCASRTTRPAPIERLGLGYDVVRDINPRIIYAQVKGFGEGSPYEHNLAFDMIAQACGGTFSVTGAPDGPPTRPGISLGDTGTGMLMAITILGALRKRDATGQGIRLQVAMQDAIMHYMRINFATQGLTGKPAQRGGDKVPGVNNAPMGLYPCKPGGPNDYVYLMTSRANPDHWDRLLKLIGREDLIGDTRYATPADRVEREPEVDAIIAGLDAPPHQARGDAADRRRRHPGRRGARHDGAAERSHLRAARHHAGDAPPGARRLQDAGLAGARGRQAVARGASPVLGEHTDEVLGAWLGLSEADVAGLRRDGALG